MNREINKSIAGILLAKNRKNFQPNLTLKTGRRRESEVTLNFDPVDRNRGSNAEIGKNSCVKNLRERKRERCDVAVGQRIQISLHVYRTVALTNRIFTIPELGETYANAQHTSAHAKERERETETRMKTLEWERKTAV